MNYASPSKNIRSGSRALAAALAAVLCATASAFGAGQNTPPSTSQGQSSSGNQQPTSGQSQGGASSYTYYHPQSSGTVTAGRQPPTRNEGHGVETYPGRSPHGSSDGPAIAAGATAAGLIVGSLIAAHEASPENFSKNGPQVPKQLDMSGFTVKGLVRPNWPIVVDFMLDSPGAAQVDIITSDNKHHYRATMRNQANYRAYGIFHLPPDFGHGTQVAVYQIQSVAAPGSNAAPRLRIFGLGAGDNAVGSVSIDQLTFQPPEIHPKVKEVATYGFHAHSAFDGVRAEFVFATLYNGHLLVQKESEDEMAPIGEGERGRGTWPGKGKAGEHMLQVRAWRGLQNGGDWVVAWSPDIVDVIK